jgi:hypothetical protein
MLYPFLYSIQNDRLGGWSSVHSSQLLLPPYDGPVVLSRGRPRDPDFLISSLAQLDIVAYR